jgi:hypothetical protein
MSPEQARSLRTLCTRMTHIPDRVRPAFFRGLPPEYVTTHEFVCYAYSVRSNPPA